jgi:N-6 DNA Methylase
MKGIAPYPNSFPPALEDYCEHMRAAIAQNKHHDQRRHLFISFLRKGLGIDADEIELEHKIKVNEVRGRIDALFRFLIIEFKSDLDRERDDAHRELKKYFESRPRPSDYVALITDGMRFEVCIYTSAGIKHISTFEFQPDAPLNAFRHLDQILFTGKRLIPSSGDIVVRFGSNSAVFNAGLRTLRGMFENVKDSNLVKTRFSEWNALLAKVYGTSLGDTALFLKHTYLTMVSRAIVAIALFPTNVRTLREYRGIVDGEFFKNQNLKNLAEPDFFSWALDTAAEKEFVEFVEGLFRLFGIYDFEKLGEDILKELYQGLVDPADRHDLGEYYTPDWLAELTLEAIQYRKGKLLDPACGSGTFLFTAVDRLRRHGLRGDKLVSYTLESILGIDAHPVAVLMAKANVLLSLRKEVREFASDISLRVYMADSLLTEEDAKAGVLKVPVSLSAKEIFHIPLASADRVDLDALIDRLGILAKRGAGSEKAKEKAIESAAKLFAPFTTKEAVYWKANFRLMLKLEAQNRDSIWAYILKNAYRPVFLRREKIDYLVGNPPWLSYRYIKDESYQHRVKDLTFEYGLLEPTERKLITQMDTSTLFFIHCSREFCKPNGTIAFVLPKSVIVPAKQHAAFQQLGFSEIHDFTGVEPLFNVRTCMLVRGPNHKLTKIPRFQWFGKLPFKNAGSKIAKKVLRFEKDRFDFIIASDPLSPYFERVFQGATLVPRCLFFVEPPKDSALNLATPFLRTSADAWQDSKREWKVKVEGKVEKDFLFGTVLAKDLIPFAVRKLCLTMLPIREDSHHQIKMTSALDALGEGFPYAHDCFVRVEKIWNKRRKDKDLTWHDRLNYSKLLTNQELHAKFIVLYNKSGTNISAAMLAPAETKHIGKLSLRGFLADHVTYRYYASSEDEAHYLVGILNSTVVNEIIKPYQSQGLLGERDIHRRPFEACPIPIFDAKNPLHLKIADIAKECREQLLPVVRKMKSPVATARADARKLVRGKLNQLDELVRKLFGNAQFSAPVVKKKEPDAQGELIY